MVYLIIVYKLWVRVPYHTAIMVPKVGTIISHINKYIYICIYIYSTTDTNYIPHIKIYIYILPIICIQKFQWSTNPLDPRKAIHCDPHVSLRKLHQQLQTERRHVAVGCLQQRSRTCRGTAGGHPAVWRFLGGTWEKIEKHMGKHGENTEKT